jgi:protein involved in polysaccharide export with SLBB domain
MLNSFKKYVGVLIFFTLLLVESVAQLPSDLSKIRSEQISDAQLIQIIKQAQSSGMSESELTQQLQSRGMPQAELQLLTERIKGMSNSVYEATGTGQDSKVLSNKRVYKGDIIGVRAENQMSRVFGSELFSGADPLFVPNLKIATPKGYIIGPEDELHLEIFGNNLSSQKMMVSPDGFINVKYAGPVSVAGVSIENAAGILRSKLMKFYPSLSSGETKLQLTLGNIRSIQITVVGAVRKPGTVTLPSIATLFNALYASGGPIENGSFRNIELIRENKVIRIADLYDFLLKGDQSSNIRLQDNDVIRVPFSKTQVTVNGSVNRTGVFEMKESEGLQQLIDFAGGFKSNAFKGRITGTRFTNTGLKVIDVPVEDYLRFTFQDGDSIDIKSIINRFENRVVISGEVFKPGNYSLEKGMTVKDLIVKAEGLKEEAFTGRANMVRFRDDLTKEYISLDLRAVLNGSENIVLKKEDSLHVVSLLELRERSYVSIAGPVKRPGDYPFEDSITLESLLLQAGGFLENATPTNIEIGRRKGNINLGEKGAATSEVITVDMKKDLSKIGEDIYLKPFDVVSIKLDPAKVKQITVKVSGEVLYAGTYTLENPEEKLSSIIKRAGGLLPYADISGARLIRYKRQMDTSQMRRLAFSSLRPDDKVDSSIVAVAQDLNNMTTQVALDLEKIMGNPDKDDDITLEDKDELIVPRFNNTVMVSGAVMKPVTVQFERGRSASYFLSAAGGFTRNANKSRLFVVYPNGRSAKTNRFLGIRQYPKITSGSSVFVPAKTENKAFEPAKAGVLVSAFSAILTALVLLLR